MIRQVNIVRTNYYIFLQFLCGPESEILESDWLIARASFLKYRRGLEKDRESRKYRGRRFIVLVTLRRIAHGIHVCP